MRTQIQTKLTVQLMKEGDDKLIKQNFANVVAAPDEAAILSLGNIIASLAPAETELDSVVETVSYQYK